MRFDSLTLFSVNTVASLFVGIILLAYYYRNETCKGFGYWTAAAAIAAAGYLSVFLRAFFPESLSVALANTFFLLSMLLRLDGALYFSGAGRMGARHYLTPLIILLFPVMYYTIQSPSMESRNLALSLAVLAVNSIMAWKLIYPTDPAARNSFAGLIGWLNFLFGLEFLFFSILWLFFAHSFHQSAELFRQIPLAIMMIYEISSGMLVIMLNNSVTEQNLNRKIVELGSTLKEIRILSGLLPVCPKCKSVRDDKGYWQQIETYITKNSEAEFSHGFCPECVQKLYPEIDLEAE